MVWPASRGPLRPLFNTTAVKVSPELALLESVTFEDREPLNVDE